MFSYYSNFPTSATIFTSSLLSIDIVIAYQRLTRHEGGKAVLALTIPRHPSLVSRRCSFIS